MTREEYGKLKVGDLVTINHGNDAGCDCVVDFIKGDQVVIEPVDENHRFKAHSYHDCRQGSLRVIIWWQLDYTYKKRV